MVNAAPMRRVAASHINVSLRHRCCLLEAARIDTQDRVDGTGFATALS